MNIGFQIIWKETVFDNITQLNLNRRSRVLLPLGSLEFFFGLIPPAALWPWSRLNFLTEMSIRGISWGGKGDRCVGLTTLPPSCAGCREIWEPQSPGNLRACPGLYRDCFAFSLLFLTFRHRASCILGQAFQYSPENAFYIFNQQIYFII